MHISPTGSQSYFDSRQFHVHSSRALYLADAFCHRWLLVTCSGITTRIYPFIVCDYFAYELLGPIQERYQDSIEHCSLTVHETKVNCRHSGSYFMAKMHNTHRAGWNPNFRACACVCGVPFYMKWREKSRNSERKPGFLMGMGFTKWSAGYVFV